MFVNTQADVSPFVSMRREIKSFVAKRADQRRKKEAIDRLKSFQPFSARTPQREEKEMENVHGKKTQIPHPTYDDSMLPVRASTVISQNHADPFHAYPVPMSTAMRVYFRHCRSSRLLSTNFLIFAAGAENVLRQILRDSQIVSV
jgi:hypothetical protein